MVGLLLKKLRRFRNGLLHLLLVSLTSAVPRRSDLWLFGHRDGVFGGNSRGLFLWLSIHRPDIRAVWVADSDQVRRTLTDNGFEAVHRWSVAGALVTLRARVFVFCHGLPDVNSYLSGGALLVNLWHGIGIKATMFGDKTGPMAKVYQKWSGTAFGRTLFYEYLKRPDIVASTSDFTQDHFARQFEMPAVRCPQLGYPRLDPLTDPALQALSHRIDRSAGFSFNPENFRKVIVYAPTWRDTGRPFLEAALPDLERLSDALRSTDALLYVKTHPWTAETLPATLDNIRAWPNAIEIFPYFSGIDSLVTDYSSLFYDYIFHKAAGIVLYTFDLDQYVSTDRQMLYPFIENTAGLRLSNFDELCEAVERGDVYAGREDWRAKIADLRAKYWRGSSPVASPQVVACIEDRIGHRGRGAGRAETTSRVVPSRRYAA